MQISDVCSKGKLDNDIALVQELLPLPEVMSTQKVKVEGQGHGGHDLI